VWQPWSSSRPTARVHLVTPSQIPVWPTPQRLKITVGPQSVVSRAAVANPTHVDVDRQVAELLVGGSFGTVVTQTLP